MSGTTCRWTGREEVFEGYVLDALSADEKDAFEEHYFSCAACFDKLRTYRALRAELCAEAVAETKAPAREGARPWRWVLVPVAVGLVLVAIIAVWRGAAVPRNAGSTAAATPVSAVPSTPDVPTGGRTEPPPTATQAIPPVPTTSGATRGAKPAPPPVVALSVLARVEPPGYIPVVLRGPSDEAVERFEAAMRRYAVRDYAGAIPDLSTAVGLNPKAAQASFFLAICHLLTNRPEEAAAGLQRTIALGETPYLEESHFYLAKVRLSQGDEPSARKELGETIARRGRLEDDARRLLAQLDGLDPRK